MHESVPFVHHFLYVQVVFMAERFALVDVQRFSVQDRRVSCVYYILYEMGRPIHFSHAVALPAQISLSGLRQFLKYVVDR